MSFWGKKPGEFDEGQFKEPVKSSLQTPSPAVLSPQGAQSEQPRSSQAASSIDPEEAIAERFGGKLRSVLGPGTVIQGKLSFDTPVRIDGKLSGEVFSSRALIVGPTGSIDAKLEVASLLVMGKVSGSVKASERIEIFPGGIVSADISTSCLIIDNGVFNGNCAMESATKIVQATTLSAQSDQSGVGVDKKPKVETAKIAPSRSERGEAISTSPVGR